MAHAIAANSWHSNAADKKLVYETDAMPLSQGLTHEIMRNEGFDPKAAERRQGFIAPSSRLALNQNRLRHGVQI